MKKYSSKLTNLPGCIITKSHANDYRLVFWVKLKPKYGICPKCKAKTNKVYETRLRKINHSFWDHRPCRLLVLTRKFRCSNCKTRFWELLPGIKNMGKELKLLKTGN